MTDRADRNLESIKRLLVLLLMKIGTDATEIATALGVDKGTVSRMVPKRKIKPLPLRR